MMIVGRRLRDASQVLVVVVVVVVLVWWEKRSLSHDRTMSCYEALVDRERERERENSFRLFEGANKIICSRTGRQDDHEVVEFIMYHRHEHFKNIYI